MKHQELLDKYNAWLITFQIKPNISFKQWYEIQYKTQYKKQWKLHNKDKVAAQMKRYQLKHPEIWRASASRYQKRHKEKFRQYQKKYWTSLTDFAENKNKPYGKPDLRKIRIFIKNGLSIKEIAFRLKRSMYSINRIKHELKQVS